MFVTGLMSKQSEDLREQARRAERLAAAVSGDEASIALKAMSKAFYEDAERLERSDNIAAPRR